MRGRGARPPVRWHRHTADEYGFAPCIRARFRGYTPPSLAASAAERHLTCSGTHAASLRFAEQVPFTSIHALEAMAWIEHRVAGGPLCGHRPAGRESR
ncbi:hypothetical protein ACFV3F_44015 [Streptomyces sp. NPDC059717]|uniref:hypothetical protein n=1 Tax=Streptomyces sp. NPDC059717 TaxID=3346922 RepID=UPI0036B73F27